MKKVYAVIIEEGNLQTVEEVKTIDDVLDTLLGYTDYFTIPEDGMCEELIERRYYLELAKAIAYCCCNQEPQTSYGKRYCEILNEVKNLNTIEGCYLVFPKLNMLLSESGHQVEALFDEREDDGEEPLGPCGL